MKTSYLRHISKRSSSFVALLKPWYPSHQTQYFIHLVNEVLLYAAHANILLTEYIMASFRGDKIEEWLRCQGGQAKVQRRNHSVKG